MRAFFVQISGLAGLVAFLNNLWNNASVERTVFVSLTVGLFIYFTLVMGDRLIQQILSKTEPPVPDDAKVTNETITQKTAARDNTPKKPAGASKAEPAQA